MIAPLRGLSPVYLDTAPFIYFLEDNQQFAAVVEPILRAIDQGDTAGITSYITLLEVLVKPLERNALRLARQYRDLLLSSRNLRLLEVGESVAEGAARIRARYGFRTPDAIQLASAQVAGARVFVTNDVRLRSFAELPVVVLSDHVAVH